MLMRLHSGFRVCPAAGSGKAGQCLQNCQLTYVDMTTSNMSHHPESPPLSLMPLGISSLDLILTCKMKTEHLPRGKKVSCAIWSQGVSPKCVPPSTDDPLGGEVKRNVITKESALVLEKLQSTTGLC